MSGFLTDHPHVKVRLSPNFGPPRDGMVKQFDNNQLAGTVKDDAPINLASAVVKPLHMENTPNRTANGAEAGTIDTLMREPNANSDRRSFMSNFHEIRS